MHQIRIYAEVLWNTKSHKTVDWRMVDRVKSWEKNEVLGDIMWSTISELILTKSECRASYIRTDFRGGTLVFVTFNLPTVDSVEELRTMNSVYWCQTHSVRVLIRQQLHEPHVRLCSNIRFHDGCNSAYNVRRCFLGGTAFRHAI